MSILKGDKKVLTFFFVLLVSNFQDCCSYIV